MQFYSEKTPLVNVRAAVSELCDDHNHIRALISLTQGYGEITPKNRQSHGS